MKAIVCTSFGPPDVLKLTEVQKPEPKDHEVRIKVEASSVGYGDLVARNFRDVSPRQFNMPFLFWFFAKLFFGFRKPRITILGSQFAGVIESAGKDVKAFKPGDPVFGYLGQRMGAYAEYICMPETGMLAIMPANLSAEEAASVPYGGMMAMNLLRQANVQPGHKVLIVGASGGIGSAAVQIAKSFGAEVTGVCGPPGLAFVQSIGADKVIDYTREDFTGSGESYDLILDILGRGSFSRSRNVLKPNGRYVYASFKTKQLLHMLWSGLTGNKKVRCALAAEKIEDLIAVKALVEAGKLRAVIDRRYPLEQTAEAHQYAESGHKQGSVAITLV